MVMKDETLILGVAGFLILLGPPPHMRLMGVQCTCVGTDESELTAMHAVLDGP